MSHHHIIFVAAANRRWIHSKIEIMTSLHTQTVREKECCACGIAKPASSFWERKTSADGLWSRCKSCSKTVSAVDCSIPSKIFPTAHDLRELFIEVKPGKLCEC